MDVLPVEAPGWLDHFKAQIILERSIIGRLIQWGFTESAFDICKKIEERFNEGLQAHAYRKSFCFRLPEADKMQIREILRDHYLKTREIPRRQDCRELLHNGLLTGFEELGDQLVQLYEAHFECHAQILASERVA